MAAAAAAETSQPRAKNAFRRRKVSFRRENSVSGRYFILFVQFLRFVVFATERVHVWQ